MLRQAVSKVFVLIFVMTLAFVIAKAIKASHKKIRPCV
jgi:hypothetical protein